MKSNIPDSREDDLSTVILLGWGKLNRQLPALLPEDTRCIAASRHTPDALPPNTEHVRLDVTRPGDFTRLPGYADALVYCLSPQGRDEAAYQAVFDTGLRNLIARFPRTRIGRLIFVSSTSVYAQNDGCWVDETSETQPVSTTARILLRGEQRLREAAYPLTVVRFSGIYGGSRSAFLDAVLTGQVPVTPPSPWTNRVHEQDAAGILAHLVSRSLRGESLDDLYIGTDCEPVQRHVLARWILDHSECGTQPLPDAQWPARGGSKRLSNARLLATGYDFRHPDYMSGYAAMLRESGHYR
ncbi:MAG: NAD-dependent epimerase [Gammaproteobacteria bacterium]|nr:MAG: NAD-dependent epimerase [Gammaproteobacteria bacterium]